MWNIDTSIKSQHYVCKPHFIHSPVDGHLGRLLTQVLLECFNKHGYGRNCVLSWTLGMDPSSEVARSSRCPTAVLQGPSILNLVVTQRLAFLPRVIWIPLPTLSSPALVVLLMNRNRTEDPLVDVTQCMCSPSFSGAKRIIWTQTFKVSLDSTVWLSLLRTKKITERALPGEIKIASWKLYCKFAYMFRVNLK